MERNNPFDPDSDIPYSEKYVTVKGQVFRGYSDETLNNVEVMIGDQWTMTDSDGSYQLQVKPGTYTLSAARTGWMIEEYEITVSASKNSSQREDISMFIWYDDFETYNLGFPPPLNNPWYYDFSVEPSSGVAETRIAKNNDEYLLYSIVASTNDPMANGEVILMESNIPTPNHDGPRITESVIAFGQPAINTEYVYTLETLGGSFDIFITAGDLSVGRNGTPETAPVSFASYWDQPIVIQTYLTADKTTLYIDILDIQNFESILGAPYIYNVDGETHDFGAIRYKIRWDGGAIQDVYGDTALLLFELY